MTGMAGPVEVLRAFGVHLPIGGLLNPNSIVGCTGCRWRPRFETRAWVPTSAQWSDAHDPAEDPETRETRPTWDS